MLTNINFRSFHFYYQQAKNVLHKLSNIKQPINNATHLFLWNARFGSNLPLNDLLTVLDLFISLSYVKVIGCCYKSSTLFLITQSTLPSSPYFTLFEHIYYHKQPHFQLEWNEGWSNSSAVKNSIMVCYLKCTDPYALKTFISQTLAIQLFVIVISWQLKLKKQKKMSEFLNHQFCHALET